MFDLPAVQAAIREAGLDGWLLYDFRGLNVLAQRVAGVAGEALAALVLLRPGDRRAEEARPRHRAGVARSPARGRRPIYRRWQELEAGVGELVSGAKRVAMEYSAAQRQPVHRPRRCRHGRTGQVVRRARSSPSGDLIQLFEATWDDEQEKSHFEAAKHCRDAYDVAFDFIADGDQAKGQGDRDGGAGPDHEALRRQQDDDLQPADRRRRPAQRRPALRHEPRDRHCPSSAARSC